MYKPASYPQSFTFISRQRRSDSELRVPRSECSRHIQRSPAMMRDGKIVAKSTPSVILIKSRIEEAHHVEVDIFSPVGEQPAVILPHWRQGNREKN